MAGVQAGRLSIEIVAEIARLQQDLDKAKRAVKAASGDIAKSAQAANDNLAGMASRMGKIAPNSRMAAFGMRNLAFQAQDLGLQLAMASQSSDPLRMSLMAFAMQGPQIRDAFKQTGQSVTGLVTGFARAHPILLGIATAAGVAYGGLKLFASQVDQTGELDRYANSLGLTKKEMEKLGPASVTVGDAITGLWRTIDDGLGLSQIFSAIGDGAVDAFRTVLQWGQNAAAGIYAGFVGTYNGIKAVWPMLPRVIGDAAVQAANTAISAIEKLVNNSIDGLNLLIEGANQLLGTNFAALQSVDFGRIENQFEGAGRDAANAFAAAYRDAYSDAQAGFASVGQTIADNILQASKDRLASNAAAIIDDRTEKGVGDRARKVGKTAAEKLFEQLVKDARSYIGDLEEQIAKFGKSALEIHRMEVAAKAAAAPTKELADRIRQLGGELETLMVGEANAAMEERLQELRDELSLLGLTGAQRELAALALEKEAFMAKATADGVSDVNAKWEEYLRLRTEIINGESALEHEAKAAERLVRQLDTLVGLLGRQGGIGGVIGGLLQGISTGSFSGMGPLGGLADVLLRARDFEKMGEIIAQDISKVFGVNGPFAKTLAGGLQAAGIGAMAGNAVFGNQGTAGQAGSAIGGILGGIGGKALAKGITAGATKALGSVLGGAIGSAVPVVGTILGGLAGGLIGKLFGGSKPYGTARVTGSSISSTGKGDGRAQGASALGGSVQDTLAQIADQLGAEVGSYLVSIGTYKDNYRVSTRGGTGKLGGHDGSWAELNQRYGLYDFGTDQGGAIAFAVMDAIKDGAIKGISAGAQRLLQGGSDVEQAMQKAMAFEGVFQELERMKDPAAAALAELDKEFAQLKTIFDEAGASADEYAKLEELRSLKRAELEKQSGDASDAISRKRELEIELMQAQGNYMGALAVTRQQELAELPESLRALQEQVWAAQLLNDRRMLEIQLMEAQGDAAGALAAQREMELSATHESLRGLKEQVWAAQDAAEAARAAEQLRDAWSSVGDNIMEEVRRIRGLTDTGTGGSFAALMGRFNAMTAAARAGDMDAAKDLPGLSQDLLRAAELVARSRQELDRVRAQTAASLETTNAAIASLSSSDAALLAAAASQENTAGANDNLAASIADSNRTLREEMEALRAEMKASLAAVASNTGRVAKKLDDVTASTGGDAIATRAA